MKNVKKSCRPPGGTQVSTGCRGLRLVVVDERPVYGEYIDDDDDVAPSIQNSSVHLQQPSDAVVVPYPEKHEDRSCALWQHHIHRRTETFD